MNESISPCNNHRWYLGISQRCVLQLSGSDCPLPLRDDIAIEKCHQTTAAWQNGFALVCLKGRHPAIRINSSGSLSQDKLSWVWKRIQSGDFENGDRFEWSSNEDYLWITSFKKKDFTIAVWRVVFILGCFCFLGLLRMEFLLNFQIFERIFFICRNKLDLFSSWLNFCYRIFFGCEFLKLTGLKKKEGKLDTGAKVTQN